MSQKGGNQMKGLYYNKYEIGAPLYCPADNIHAATNILNGKLGYLRSIIFCMEDSILPQRLKYATDTLKSTINQLKEAKDNGSELPYIFIRIRNAEHLEISFENFQSYKDIITGFVLPKYDPDSMKGYEHAIYFGWENCCFMPLLETSCFIKADRKDSLQMVKESLSQMRCSGVDIPNILLGTNDMCSYYKIRRNSYQSIWDISFIHNAIADIVAELGEDYIINGSIWEFFDGEHWREGLLHEFELDQLNGLVGKACIHPNQVKEIHEAMKVSADDYNDARSILSWGYDKGVVKSNQGRMDEIATNLSWAEKIKVMGDIYGIKKEIVTKKY